MSISLFVTRGTDKGKSFSLVKDRITIGRDLSNDITICDEEVSRRHCSLVFVQDQIELIDDGSSNGTFVNGDRIDSAVVCASDSIRVGQTYFSLGSSSNILIQSDPSKEETNVVEQMALDTCVMPAPQATEDASDPFQEDAGRRFVRIQNDLRFVYQASLTTSRQVDTLKMFEELLELIFGWVAADRGCVFLRDGQTDEFPIRLIKNRSEMANSAFEVCDSIVEYVMDQKVGVLSSSPDDSVRQVVGSHVSSVQVGEVICVPIQSRGSGLLGMFYVDTLVNSTSTRVPRFSKDHLRLMLSMANQAAMVVENDTYYRSMIEKERLSAVGETVALLSHQVNNILQGINGGRHLLELGLDQNRLDMARQGWSVVERNQERVSKLILDLVFLSQDYEPKLDSGNLLEILENAVAAAKNNSESGEFTFLLDSGDSQSIPVNANCGELRQAFQNILGLCAQASRGTDEIHVSVNGDSGAKVFFVYQGVEIYSSRQIDDVRHQEISTGVFGGIELAMSKKLIIGHGGSLEMVDLGDGRHQIEIQLR